MTASCEVPFPIHLMNLSVAQPRYCSYEPELFPGLVYRFGNPKVVMLIFVSGRIIVTGAKCEKDIEAACDKIYSVLSLYRKKEKSSSSSGGGGGSSTNT